MTPFIFQVLAVLGVVGTVVGIVLLLSAAASIYEDGTGGSASGCGVILIMVISAALMAYLVIYLIFPNWFIVTLPAQ